VANGGRLIVFEGGEGSGKSTQLRLLADALAATGVAHRCLREPGGTELGNEVRHLVLERDWRVVPRAEALLFMASRAQLVEREIRPAMERGEHVLLDRFFLSTYAYQIGGHGLPEADVRAANSLATGGLVPDVTLLLTYPVTAGLARAAQRSSAHDRIEWMGEAFHTRVAESVSAFASPDGQRMHPEFGPIVSIEAVGSERDVASRVRESLTARWPGTFPQLEASDV
jgi:dTMP kinase